MGGFKNGGGFISEGRFISGWDFNTLGDFHLYLDGKAKLSGKKMFMFPNTISIFSGCRMSGSVAHLRILLADGGVAARWCAM